MVLPKQTAFRLTDDDLAILDEAKAQTGAVSRAEALRAVLRFWAAKNPPKPKAKPKQRQK